MHNGKQRYKLLKKHMEATVEESTGQSNALGLRNDITRLIASARAFWMLKETYRGVNDLAQMVHGIFASQPRAFLIP